MEAVRAHELAEDLHAVPIFADLSVDMRRRVASASTVVHLPGGDWLFRQGDPGECLYVLHSGRLEVVLESSGQPVVIRILTKGTAVGELALMTDEARSASVRAIRDSVLLRVDRAQFEDLLRELPEFGLALTRVLARQLRLSEGLATHRRPGSSLLTVTAAHPGLLDTELRRHLLRALGQWTGIGYLDSSLAPPELADAGRLLDRHEANHELVVLFADGQGGDGESWNEFCLRQADQLLVVIDATRSPTPADRFHGGQPCHVAFIGRVPTASQLGPWLDVLEPRTHTFVDPDSKLVPAVERLARRLLGRSLGVVLSGGGARGFAHVGVLDALVQSGLDVDRVGGCSMGAFIGGLFAMGLSPGEMQGVCRTEWVERNPLNDYTLPRASLIRAKKVTTMLRRVFGEREIEELPRSYFAVSCDLVTANTIVHRRGPVWLAAGSSMALPALIPPIRHEDGLLVDGGVLNNLPVDLMLAEGAGPVIAVSVMSKAIAERAVGTRLPNIVETVARSMVMGSARLAEENHALANVVISPDLGDTGLLDFRRLDEMADAGRRAALAALDSQGESLALA